MRHTPCIDILYVRAFCHVPSDKLSSSKHIKASSLSTSSIEVQDFDCTVDSFADISYSGTGARIFRKLSET